VNGGSIVDGVEKIISELKKQRDAIERALAALREIGGGSVAAAATAAPAKRRGRPPGSKNQGESVGVGNARSEAQKRRWAENRAAKGGQQTAATPARKKSGGKRNISAEGKARIAEAARRMWAARKRVSQQQGASKKRV
jgi:hypothetical protein